MKWRVGVDIGGTFTDLVAYNAETGEVKSLKVLTKPRAPEEGVVEAIEALGEPIDSIEVIVHATTLGTNMFFGQTGLEPPNVVLITNKGFRDVIEIGRQNRPELYNLFFEKPKPLVPRSRRIGVGGRIGPRGEELEPLDRKAIIEVAKRYCSSRTVYVISFLHCYVNAMHEEEAARLVREACPEAAAIVTGCSVDPEPGEYERTSTAIVNAMLKPMFEKYIERLVKVLKSKGFKGRLLVMQSSGGVADPEFASEKPALFIESGPAAGAVATAYLASIRRDRLVVGFDMGGTTAKAVLVVDGRPSVAPVFEVGGKFHMGRRVKGSGYPVRAPYIDLVEVSAGGGTIAWVDKGGALRVGPKSAGADPGPACYGKGGREPTITDAHAILGRLPDYLAGGRIKVRKDLALEAYRKLASKLGMDPAEVAEQVLRIANTVMAKAIRIVTVERGYDPGMAVLYAYGGAGPLHAAELAAELGVERVLIPPYPGVFSALGLLLADYRHDLYHAVYKPIDSIDFDELDGLFAELEEKARRRLLSEGVSDERIKMIRLLELRYRGQTETIEVGWSSSRSLVVERFEDLYMARYGYLPPTPRPPIELVRLHLVSIGIVDKPRLVHRLVYSSEPKPIAKKEIYVLGEGWVIAEVYERHRLKPGVVLSGPLLLVEDDSTVLVPSSWSVKALDDGSLMLSRRS